MTYFQRQCGVALLAMAAGCGLSAQTNGGPHGSAPASQKLAIRVEHGNVEVHGKAGLNEVQWSLRNPRRANESAVSASIEGDTLVLRGMSVDMTVNVPVKYAVVSLHTGSGDLTLTDVTANADLMSDGGNLKLDHVTGQVSAKTAGGNITLRSSGGPGALSRVQTSGGNVLVDAADGNWIASSGGGNVVVTAARGNVKIESGGGNVTVHQAGGGVQLETSSGNVEMGDIGGDVTASTGGGAIRLASARGMVKASTGAGAIDCRQLGSGIKAETGSGSILAEYAQRLRFVESKLETGSGDVTVWMPQSLAASIKVVADNPWGHTIRSEFDGVRIVSKDSDGALRAEGLMNGGGPLLRVETGSGNVQLLRTK